MNKHQQSIALVCDYIEQNLDDDFSLDMLSQVFGFSKFHFHRIFSSYTGLSLIKFIQVSRLKRASYRLVFKTNVKVIDIAFEAGFESAEAFSRAFKREFGQTPSEFRKQPNWSIWHEKKYIVDPSLRIAPKQTRDVKIVDFVEQKVAVLEHHGAPELHYETLIKFMSWRKAFKQSPIQTCKTYGIAYNDPNSVKPEDFRFDFCASVTDDIPENSHGVINKVIPAGRCAVLRNIGGRKDLSESVYYLYEQWLPNNNVQYRDFPVFFHYVNFISDVDEHELITDVYLPIQ